MPAALQGVDPDDIIFALDIGTRTVVGVVGVQEKDKFRVLFTEVVEHQSRAMIDGQIHDINRVAEVVKDVKGKLEKKMGFSLTKVAIAAAGRVLKTCETRVERELEQGREIDQELIGSIEMEGIQLAQAKLDADMTSDEKTQFYCVGYSVINYYLNGYVISQLLGHKGKSVGVEILATFLPHIVVDSLYTVMSRVGLEVISLTLEPIAAINVTIPKDLRLLNLALVDIGAGTSDIAITRNGSVVAYAMVPTAGDEITEKIAQYYLVDFNTAEKIKIAMSLQNDNVTFTDILGKKQSVSPYEVTEVIRPSLQYLAETISRKILEYNHKSPNAVFLIGGGSQVPGLTGMIADQLGLQTERVAVRGRDVIQNIKFNGKKLIGPEAVTPLGIAITAQLQRGQDFLTVVVNGRKIRLFNSKRLTVADSLILIGFNPNQLIGRSGKSISFEINGARKIIRGEPGKPAEIFVNGKTANLETILSDGDEIRVVPAEDGRNAEARVSDFVSDAHSFSITFDGVNIDAGTKIYMNGKLGGAGSIISDGDRVQVETIKTLADIIKLSEIDTEGYTLKVNGRDETFDYLLKNGDIIICSVKSAEVKQAREIQELDEVSAASETDVMVSVNGLTNQIEETVLYAYDDGFMNVTVNGKIVTIKMDKASYIFVDIFNYIDFDLSRPQGSIVMTLNGKAASFTDTISQGDIIEIYWEKK